MSSLVIQGNTRLRGSVRIGGAKNSALELISAALLTPEPVILYNVPDLSDIDTLCRLIESLGAKVERDKASASMRIQAKEISSVKADYEIVSKMRASIYVLGALLGRTGEAKVASPGGCVIGSRPINAHLDAFAAMGASIGNHHGYIVAKAIGGRMAGGSVNGLVKTANGTAITTHGGNVNAIQAAVLAKGRTVIRHASLEPEIDDLIAMLSKMGARIKRSADGEANTIEIDGVQSLGGCEFFVMPDRIEAATYAIAAAMTRGRIEITGASTDTMGAVVRKLREAGAEIENTPDGFAADGTRAELRAVDVEVSQYPGFPTDAQSQFMTMMCTAKGECVLRETLFENRLMYAAELARMGADIEILDPQTARFRGVKKLYGADVKATDLRSGAALTIAGLCADGITRVIDAKHIYRGYQNFAANLRAMGAEIEVEE
ncbi:MAG: UDP-N-acetylglucosamine 1-carboxyvinyltransferase [Rickettsiales bacterium]|nr:UDP-N-acetylglucosamine 1-carboxyvinyltransferase [Rickettsiales bacterium]